MTSARAILVSEAQRDRIVELHLLAALPFADAYDNAGDQPRIQWCVEHGDRMTAANVTCFKGLRYGSTPCRVGTAIIIVVVEEEAAE